MLDPWQPKRGTGILNNELYVGRLVWNRLRCVKNPDTGKRISRLNATTEWITKEIPSLRIVSDEVWNAAKHRQNASRRAITSGGNIGFARRPRTARQRASGARDHVGSHGGPCVAS
jgi:site-specific DNA recombinase